MLFNKLASVLEIMQCRNFRVIPCIQTISYSKVRALKVAEYYTKYSVQQCG